MARIAILLGEGVEDSEFTVPCERLRAGGHIPTVVGSKAGERVTGKRGTLQAVVEREAAAVSGEDFDALVIPGGHAPDHLRLDAAVVALVRSIANAGKPVAAICHGPQLLIEANVVRGRTLTSWPSVRTDLENAGAAWVDREVVLDANLITSRKPGDLEKFCEALLAVLDASAPGRSGGEEDYSVDDDDFEVDDEADDDDMDDVDDEEIGADEESAGR